MTNVEKGMIIAFFYCLRNITLVAQIIGRPWTTIKSFLARAGEPQSLDNLPRPGRPVLLSQQQRHTIIRAAKSNRKMTWSDFRDHYAPGVSLSTGNKKKPGVLVLPSGRVTVYDLSKLICNLIVDRILKEANIKKWVAKSRPRLKPEHVAKRLRWATVHKDWTVEDFKRVIWSDECSVEKSKDPRQQ